jgi:hypothetical protein
MSAQTRKQYAGTPVAWNGTLQSGTDNGIILIPEGLSQIPPGIYVPIEFPKHNFLLHAPVGTPIHVEGTISDVSPFVINLRKSCTIELMENAPDVEATPTDVPARVVPPSPTTSSPDSSQLISPNNLTLASIIEAIEGAPPMLRDTVMNRFVGTPVSWDGRLVSSHADGENISILLEEAIESEDDSKWGESFWAPVRLPQDNFLLQLPEGALLHVVGVIDSFILGDAPMLRDATVTPRNT